MEIQARLKTVERECRIQRIVLLLLVVALAVVVGMGASAPPKKTLEAQEFVVRDADGKVWGKLGRGELALMDPDNDTQSPTYS